VKQLTKRALQATGLFPVARAVYRRLNRDIQQQGRRGVAFYSAILPANALCFDIGANLGQKTEIFLACGARVITVEPNSKCLPSLVRYFGRDPRVTILAQAVGAEAGTMTLHIDGTSSTASARSDWNATVYGKAAPDAIRVPVTTLDALVKRYGSPDFIKIDVEGFEADVLRGLTRPVPLLSFEYHAREIDRLRECLSILQAPITVRASDHDCVWRSDWMAAEPCIEQISAQRLNGDLFVRQ
jgi:FkbM family methyltransferase